MTGFAVFALAVVGQCLPCDVGAGVVRRVGDASSAVLSPVVSPLLELGERGAELVEPVARPIARSVVGAQESDRTQPDPAPAEPPDDEAPPAPESSVEQELAKLLATVHRLNRQLSEQAIVGLLKRSPEYVEAMREQFLGRMAAAELDKRAALERGDLFEANQADRAVRHWRRTGREWDRAVSALLELPAAAPAPEIDPPTETDPES